MYEKQDDSGNESKPTLAGWCKRLKQYGPVLLALLAAENFDRGLRNLRELAMLDILKNKFGSEPADTQWYFFIMWSPWMFKLPYGIFIDFEFLSRKTLLIVMAVLATTTHAFIALDVLNNIDHIVYCMLTLNFSSAFMDVLTKTILLRESRHNPETGFKDL